MGSTATASFPTRCPNWVNQVVTANGVGPTQGVTGNTGIKIFVKTTAAGGSSPTLNLFLQTMLPDETSWMDIAAFAQITGNTSVVLDFLSSGSLFSTTVNDGALAATNILAVLLGFQVRLKWVVGGTSPTFTLAAHAIFW